MLNPGVSSKFSIEKARNAQRNLAERVITEDKLPAKINLVAGVDAAYAGDLAIGVVAVLNYNTLKVLETQSAHQMSKFPYLPTLFSFRELPAVVAAIKKLKLKPDVFLVDAHGRAHPHRCGFASHLGLSINKPTIGAAKSRLIGEPTQIGTDIFLIDKGDIVAEIVTHGAGRPVYVSTGHMVSLSTAVQIVRNCTQSGRIPQPILAAHRKATEERKAQITVT